MNRRSASLWHGRRPVWGLLAGCLLLPSIMLAQPELSSPPKAGPPPEVHLAEYSSFTLSNGMRVIVVENRKLPLVSVQVRFDIPPILQGDRAGYIDMVGDLLSTGTGLRNKSAIDEEVDQLGAQFFTTPDGVYASGLKRHLPDLMDIVTDVTTNSTFPEKELERLRTRYRSSVMQRKDDPDAIAEAVGRSVTFSKTHPYGEVITEKSIDNISRENLFAYYQRFFRPEAGYLVFVGDITIKEAKDMAKKHFNKWKVPMNRTVNEDGTEAVEGLGAVRFLDRPSGPSGKRRVVMVDRPGAAQSVIRVSFPLNLEPRDMRSMSAQVMNTILGGGVFNARLMQNLRETKAFTYGAYSNLEVDRFNGSFTATVSVRTDVTDSAITEILGELHRMRFTPVTDDELYLAKSYMAGSFARSLEDPRTVARFALNTYLNELPKDHYATYLKRLDEISAGDVEAAAQAFLHPDQAIIFVVGDKEKIQYKLPALAMNPNAPILILDENGERYREDLTPVPELTAQRVVENYLEAIGGRSAIGKIQDMQVNMVTLIGDLGLGINQWYGPGKQFRSETRTEEAIVQEVIMDGQRAVSRTPQGDEELLDVDLWDVLTTVSPVPEVDLTSFAERMTLSGKTTVKGKEAYKVTISTMGGSTIADYYSVETGLKIRRVEQKFMGGRPMTITTDYESYRLVNGVQFPYTIIQAGGPMGEMRLMVENIAVNQGLPPGFFETGLPPISDDEE